MRPTDDGAAQRVETIARGVLELQWNEEHAYTSPNPTAYPWMWLWDSCFNAVVWAHLGDRRATDELSSVFTWQRSDGFVPHMGYQADPAAAVDLWGIKGASTITQPPMYGHAFRVLKHAGHQVDHLADHCVAGLEFLLKHRRDSNGLVLIVHPWESGCDDSPRWDHWAGTPFDRPTWLGVKKRLLGDLVISPTGSSISSTGFSVASAGFNALVAFNLKELADALGAPHLAEHASAITAAIDDTWDEGLQTWPDLSAGGVVSSSVRTLDSLLPVLVTRHGGRAASVFDQIFDPGAFGDEFGPRGVHVAEPSYDPSAYWRGPAWPHLTYLLGTAAGSAGRHDIASRLAVDGRRAALVSRFAEYLHPTTGRGLGAMPQSWACLAAAR